MDCQPVLADRNTLDKAGSHHPPADGALQPAQRQYADELRRKTSFDAARRPKEDQRQRKHKAHAPREQAMRPFPPEDRLERVNRHALVDLAELRDLLVLQEFFLPIGIVERRDDAMDRLPFRDRQAGPGHSRCTTDEDQCEQHQQDRI